MYPCREGFFWYWQKQGLCCRSFPQQPAVGGAPFRMASAHGLSAIGLHVTAADATEAVERRRRRRRVERKVRKMKR